MESGPEVSAAPLGQRHKIKPDYLKSEKLCFCDDEIMMTVRLVFDSKKLWDTKLLCDWQEARAIIPPPLCS